MRHAGACHCGELRVTFESNTPLAPRACQCTFCRKHDGRWVSDPDGRAAIATGPATTRYRFGTGSADFLICGRCGVCLAAIDEIDGLLLAVLNLTAFDDPRPELASERTDFDGETGEARTARRKARWTPAALIEG